jgi:hypothetical protein
VPRGINRFYGKDRFGGLEGAVVARLTLPFKIAAQISFDHARFDFDSG